MSTTTTTSVKKASQAMSAKIQKTEADMKKKMTRAGFAEYRTVKVLVPKTINEGDDVLTIGLNGELFYFLRGKSVNMPEQLAKILENTGSL